MKKFLLLLCVLGIKKAAIAVAGIAKAKHAGNAHAAGQQNTLSAFIIITFSWILTC